MNGTSSPPQNEDAPGDVRRWWRRRWFRFTLGAILILSLVSFGVIQYVLRNAEPILRKRIIETLSARFDAPVELDQLHISPMRGVEVEGEGLRIPLAGAANGETPAYPLLVVHQFRFRTTLRSLFHQPMRVARVEVDGLELHIPPPSQRASIFGTRDGKMPADPKDPRTKPKIAIVVHELLCRNVKLSIESGKPNKEPLIFDIRSLLMRDVGKGQAMLYEAELVNPKPHGVIHAKGHFGPWAGKMPSDAGASDPGKTPLDGEYRFDHADLNSIRGIGGMLSSAGHYRGVLERLQVTGTTEVPDFSLDMADHAVPLHTSFEAVVDGTSGDTYLNRVEARLLHSDFKTSGKIVNIKGRGHDIDLQVNIPAGRMQDFLRLAVKTNPPVLNGTLALQARLHIPPGRERVPLKMRMTGNFQLEGIQFNNPQWQDRIDGLSARASGRPGEVAEASHNREAETHSRMRSDFTISDGIMSFADVEYGIPGARVLLNGVYSMDGKLFEFKGHVRTQAAASQMVTGWKSWLLKPVDPFLKRGGAGLELPISINGTGGEVHMGLALHGADDKPAEILKDMRRDDKRRRIMEAARKEAALANTEDRRAATAGTLEAAEAEHQAAVRHRAEASRLAAEAAKAGEKPPSSGPAKPR